MGMLQIIGFEIGSQEESAAVAGTYSIQSSVVRSGGYALRVNPVGAGSGYYRIGLGTERYAGVDFNSATLYARIYVRIDTLPSANYEQLFSFGSSASRKLYIKITSAGKLQIYDRTNTQIGSDGTTVLNTGEFYKIDAKCGTGNPADYEIKINDIVEFSGTADVYISNNTLMYLGKANNENGESVDYYFDDVAVADDDYPVAGQINVMRADGDGTYTDFTIQAGGGSDWQNVDELPHDGNTTCLTSDLDLNDAETVTLDGADGAGVLEVISCVKAVCLLKTPSTTSSSATKVRIRSGSTDSDEVGTIPMSSVWDVYQQLLENDPDTGSPWTKSGLDGVEVGAIQNGVVRLVWMTAVYLMVDSREAEDKYGPRIQVI